MDLNEKRRRVEAINENIWRLNEQFAHTPPSEMLERQQVQEQLAIERFEASTLKREIELEESGTRTAKKEYAWVN